jgi:hypothetical protein
MFIIMEDNIDLKSFIKDRLDLLDKTNAKYEHLINNNNVEFIVGDDNNYIKFKDNHKVEYEGKVSLLGAFDNNSKLWLWAWAIPSFNYNEIRDSKNILEYGLMLEPNTNSKIHYYIKPHLVNSRLLFENEIFLDIHLALSLYISKKAKFIYPRLKEKINGKDLIVYYLVY